MYCNLAVTNLQKLAITLDLTLRQHKTMLKTHLRSSEENATSSSRSIILFVTEEVG